MTLKDTDLLPITRPTGADAGTYSATFAALRAAVGSSAIQSNTAPANPINGQLWVDTNSKPPELKIYDQLDGKWNTMAGATPDKKPTLEKAVLSDVAGGGRFTSTSFPVVTTVTDAGSPAPTMKLKAYVYGSLPTVFTTSTISSIGTSAIGPVYSGGPQGTGTQAPIHGDFTHANADWTKGFDGSLSTAATLTGDKYWNSIRFTPIQLGEVNEFCYSQNDTGNGDQYTNGLFYAEIDGVRSDHLQGSGVLLRSTPTWQSIGPGLAGKTLTGWQMKCINANNGNTPTMYMYGFRVSGTIIVDRATKPTLTLSGTTNLSNLTVGLTVKGATSNATAVVLFVSGAALTIDQVSGTFQVGEALKFTKVMTGTTLYAVHNSSGAISTLQPIDPGFSVITGASPYSHLLTFPATFPTGNAPDVDLPAGTTLKAEVEASNVAGTATVTSNTITPA